MVNTFSPFLILFFILNIVTIQAQQNDTTWRVLPIRSYEEFEAGAFGGEGEQHPHSIARCLNHPEYIYLSHDVGGSWRSTDNGDTWHKNTDKGLFMLFGQSIEVDPFDPDIVFLIIDQSFNYLGGEYKGIYRSTNGGESWELVLHTNTESARMFRHNIAYDITSQTDETKALTWYAAFNNNALYRSDDGGATWGEPLSSLSGHETVYQVQTHPTDGETVFVASSSGLFVSTTGGTDLQKIESLPENISSVCINPDYPESIYATAYKSGVYYSNDGGTTFNKIKSHSTIRLHMNPGFPEQLYLVGENKSSMISDDGGETWASLPEATTFPGFGRQTGWRRWIDNNLSGIAPNPKDKNEAVFYSRSTLFKTNDGCQSIFESATGWTGNACDWTNNSILFNRYDDQTFAFFCKDVGTRITTSGGDWFHASTNSEAGGWYPEKIDWYGTYAGDFYPEEGSQIIVAAIGGYFKTQLMRTENLGDSWQLVTEGDEMVERNFFVAFHPEDPNIVYAGNKISTDAGKTFQFVSFPAKYNKPYIIGYCPAHADVVYALDESCKYILRSCNRGQDWEEYTNPGWSFKYFDSKPTFAADPVDPFKIYTLDEKHDLASFDGKTWTSFSVLDHVDIDIPYNYIRNVTIDPNNPDIIYASTFTSGVSAVLRSLDAGKTWVDISYNLTRSGGNIKVNPHTGELYRGSHCGTWIFPAPYSDIPSPVDTFSVICNDSTTTSARFERESNQSNIRLMKNADFLTVEATYDELITQVSLYTLNGQKMITKNDFQSAKGNSVQLNISKVPTGVYLVQIMTAEGITTKKVVL